MAIGYMRISTVGGKTRKSSAAASYDYQNREEKYKSKAGDVTYTNNVRMPKWAESPRDFWKAADEYEKGTKAEKLIIALPNELTKDQQAELLHKWMEENFSDHAYSWTIHQDKGALSGKDNPHAHILISTRRIDPEKEEPDRKTYFKKTRTLKNGGRSGGYPTDRRMTGTHWRKWYKDLRTSWEKAVNEYLKERGINAQIDMNPVRKPGQKRTPHLGNALCAVAAKGVPIRVLKNRAAEVLEAEERKAEAESREAVDKLAPAATITQRAATFLKAVKVPGLKKGLTQEEAADDLLTRRGKSAPSNSPMYEALDRIDREAGDYALQVQKEVDQQNAAMRRYGEKYGIWEIPGATYTTLERSPYMEARYQEAEKREAEEKARRQQREEAAREAARKEEERRQEEARMERQRQREREREEELRKQQQPEYWIDRIEEAKGKYEKARKSHDFKQMKRSQDRIKYATKHLEWLEKQVAREKERAERPSEARGEGRTYPNTPRKETEAEKAQEERRIVKTGRGIARPGHERAVLITWSDGKSATYTEGSFWKLRKHHPEVADKYGITKEKVQEINKRIQRGRGTSR